MDTYCCHTCHQTKPIGEFSKNRAKSSGHQDECKACRKTFRHASSQYHKAHKLIVKREIMEHYGGCKCAVCGFSDIRALTIDHIDNNGAAHRREIGELTGHRFYLWLRRNGHPVGFQVLCANCQFIKHYGNLPT